MAFCPICSHSVLSPAQILGLTFSGPEYKCKHCGACLEVGALPLIAQTSICYSPFAVLLALLPSGTIWLALYFAATIVLSVIALRYPGIRVVPLQVRLRGARRLVIGLVIFIAIIAIANVSAF